MVPAVVNGLNRRRELVLVRHWVWSSSFGRTSHHAALVLRVPSRSVPSWSLWQQHLPGPADANMYTRATGPGVSLVMHVDGRLREVDGRKDVRRTFHVNAARTLFSVDAYQPALYHDAPWDPHVGPSCADLACQRLARIHSRVEKYRVNSDRSLLHAVHTYSPHTEIRELGCLYTRIWTCVFRVFARAASATKSARVQRACQSIGL